VLAQKNIGNHLARHVTSVIRGQADLPAHGNQEMPVGCSSGLSQSHKSEVQQRTENLNQHIESIQKKQARWESSGWIDLSHYAGQCALRARPPIPSLFRGVGLDRRCGTPLPLDTLMPEREQPFWTIRASK